MAQKWKRLLSQSLATDPPAWENNFLGQKSMNELPEVKEEHPNLESQ